MDAVCAQVQDSLKLAEDGEESCDDDDDDVSGAVVDIDDLSEASDHDSDETESDDSADIIIERVVDGDGVELPVTPPASVG